MRLLRTSFIFSIAISGLFAACVGSGPQPVALSPGANGEYVVKGGKLSIRLSGPNAIYGVCLPNALSGHFIAEATSDKTENFGLAIVFEKDGKPDTENFTSVSVSLESGIPTARVIDRQHGVDNVRDNTYTINAEDLDFRYTIPFTNDYFSVPFSGSTGKARIIRNDISGFFHFYVSVGKELNGRFHENWIELAQSKDWGESGQRYFVCPIVRNTDNDLAEVNFSEIRFEKFAASDQSDERSGFKTVRRPYTWAGFPGEAVVVNFDPRHCPAAAGDRKFVFWSEMNYVPAWHMSNELLFCYEFAETWNEHIPGCFEPMSDRLLAYSSVDVIENNAVRSVVRYKYALINPDYKAPYPDGSYPEVEEFYTFYPDGVGVRSIRYIQKPKGEGIYNFHELSEPMIISGSSSIPGDHAKEPTLVISNLAGEKIDLHPALPFDRIPEVKQWEEQIYRIRLREAPEAFCVFSFSPTRPEVSPLPIEPEFTWHRTTYQMSHWPVDKQPYLGVPDGDYDKSMATWPSQVSHSSLIGIEAKEGTSWTSHFQTDENGNKYRIYLMLLGINAGDSPNDIDAYTRAWLQTGTFSNLNGLSHNPHKTEFSKREIVLTHSGQKSCGFTYTPAGEIKNPVFRIDQWKGPEKPGLKVDQQPLVNGDDYALTLSDGALIIWLNRTISESFALYIE